MTVTTKKVNAALKAAGFDVELAKGGGYFYFYDIGDSFVATAMSGVYVSRITDLTVEEWVEEFKSKLEGA
jgi:hypothetical protein